MRYQIVKTWGTELGLSCVFRQWRAQQSHCRYLHGYALGVRVTLEATELDGCHWVYDFGNWGPFKAWLVSQFDHTTLVAEDDPALPTFQALEQQGLIQLRILPHVGCEAFSEWISAYLSPRLLAETQQRVRVQAVEVFEHGANAARVIQ